MATLSEEELIRIADPLRRNLACVPHQTPSGDEVSVKSYLESLLPAVTPDVGFDDLENRSKNLYLCCLALAAAEGEESPHLYWIPKEVSRVARSALKEISRSLSFGSDREFMCALMPFLLPSVKAVIKNSGFEAEAEVTVVASSRRTPVIYAIVAAHQFRWLVAQVILLQLKLILIVCFEATLFVLFCDANLYECSVLYRNLLATCCS